MLRAAAVALTTPPEGTSTLGGTIATAVTGIPTSVPQALWSDRFAFWLLASGLVIGYILSSISNGRMKGTFTSFWHVHRAALRAALRRTPAPTGAATRLHRDVMAC